MKMPSSTPLMARRGDPRGQVLVLFALMLVVLLLVSALAVDYGGWLVTKRNYQNSTDAAALAGAQQLTRPLTTACVGGTSKNFCAREAAWESIKTALNFGGLVPAAQADTSVIPSTTPYSANGYTVWVASPPSDAGSAYPGHVSGPGVVFVRIDHAGMDYLSRIANTNRTVSAWSTAGRFPANFAVIGMCSPTSITTNCLAGDANIKLDGTNTNLIVNTGDLGTNRWARDGGNSSGVALGPDSNAYMQLFDTCWAKASTQCQLWGYNSPNVDTSTTRAAIPLGAPIPDPGYLAPKIGLISGVDYTPGQCRGTSTALASVQVLEQTAPNSQVADLPLKLAAAITPVGPVVANGAQPTKIAGTVFDSSNNKLSGATVQITAGPGIPYTNQTTGGTGTYSFTVSGAGTFTVQASLANYSTQTFTFAVAAGGTTTQDFILSPNPGTIQGFVTQGGTGMGGVLVSSTSGGSATSAAGTGAYVISNVPVGTWTVTAALAGYVSTPASASITVTAGSVKSQDFSMAPFVGGGISGTVTDQVTGLPLYNVTMTLSTGPTTTTNTSGTYSFTGLAPGSYTLSASVAAGGFMTGSPSTPVSPAGVTVSSGVTTTQNFQLWPKGCGTGNRDKGNWDCSSPSGNNCPATTNPNGANVTCTFTQDNAIRPGTYKDININGCAWLDPTGGPTEGLASGQSAGIYHITGTISMANDSYLFGDGVTIVMDQGANFNVNNGGGFVLNYGSLHSTPGDTSTPCDLSSQKAFNDGYSPCFRTKTSTDTQDYAYAAWTTKAQTPWGSGTHPTYNDSVVNKGQELGITFYMYGSGLGNASRMKLATASMGYLFNGVLYAPNVDIQLGGGKDGQSAAGQIVGWTIEYHGGTRILQNWYGDPIDGQPFLIEPVLGE
jgi:hypothetical protein